MFVVYSKQNGSIKNIATGGQFNSIKDLFPHDYEDYEIIYNCINLDDDLTVINNPNMFKIVNKKIALKEKELSKYR